MKCEICQSADAEKAIRKEVGGKEQELYVCSRCAREGYPAITTKKVLKKKTAATTGAEVLPELVGMMIDAAIEIMNHPSPSEESVCRHCGITRSEYRKTSRLGCAMCYVAFAKELDGVVADMHRHTQHVGKQPRRGGGDDVAL
ncbi:MAG: hypothetical protein FWH21_04165 [Kiritimatiellaeota bacterium]|nr:hypothetical protein [Kiritimatiellota bacterium]